MADESQDTLARLQERLAKLNKERERILIAIQVITGENGDWSDLQPPQGGVGGAESDTPAMVPSSRRVEIRPDTFFRMSHHQAARRYLQGLGHADRLENILRAITAGGVDVGGANPLATLRATLAQNTSVFVKVSPGTFGLREFYPHMKNEDSGRSKRSKSKAKLKRKPRKAPVSKEKKPQDEAPQD